MTEVIEQPAPDGKYMIDSYGEWAAGEGVPVIEAVSVDLLTVTTRHWARFATTGTIFHLAGRGDFLTLFLFELPPAGKSAPQQHLYEEIFFVIAGQGATVVENADGQTRHIPWKAGSLFAVPMNARHHHVNESSKEPARLASVNDLRYVFNVFRNEAFVFANGARFPERINGADNCHGTRWETNEAIDLPTATMGNERAIDVTLVAGSIGAALHEIPAGVSITGPHIDSGCILLGVTGEIDLRRDADGQTDRLRRGLVTAVLPDTAYQLSNAGSGNARLLAVRMGSARYPLLRTKRNT